MFHNVSIKKFRFFFVLVKQLTLLMFLYKTSPVTKIGLTACNPFSCNSEAQLLRDVYFSSALAGGETAKRRLKKLAVIG